MGDSKKSFWDSTVGGFASQGIQGAIGAGLGLLLQKGQDRRQIRQQEKLQALEIAGQKQLTDYNQKKALEMWEATGYGAQKGQMQAAGLNPGLMYGMSGGGGQTAQVAPGNVSGGNASGHSGEAMGMAMMASQIGLMRAQADNIRADTEEKKSGQYLKSVSGEQIALDNRLMEVLGGEDEFGNNVDGKQDSVLGQTYVQNLRKIRAEMKAILDKNERERLLNNKTINKITQEIELMKKKGLTEEQILENLKKDGKLKEAEIEWNKLDLKPGNFGKFFTNIIKMFFKPR